MSQSFNWRTFWPQGRELRRAHTAGLPSQEAFLDDWATALAGPQARFLIAHAPTGLGKTAAALVPALAWIAANAGHRRVFYLVNRISQHENPIRELRTGLAECFRSASGRDLRVVDLVGRDRLCRHAAERPLAPICCDSRDDAAFTQLPSSIAAWSEVEIHLRDRCPYHVLQGLIGQADLVIADYSWLFSRPAVEGKLDRLLAMPAQTALIVDEAHNLAARVRAELDVETTIAALRLSIAAESGPVESCLTPVLDTIAVSEPDEGVEISTLLRNAGGADAVRQALRVYEEPEAAEARHSPSRRLLTLLLLPDREAIVHRVPETGGSPARLVGRVIDPTPQLATSWQRVSIGLCMSGSLVAPTDDQDEMRYQAILLGLPVNRTTARRYASPFPPRNRRWIFCPDTIGTSRRRESFYPLYAAHLEAIGQKTPGVTAAFFSSYEFLEQVRSRLTTAEQELVVVESAFDAAGDSPESMDEYRERLEKLRRQHGRAYLLAVYSGKIAEGADFAGNLIRTVVCVSVPLEWPQLFHVRLRGRFTEQFASVTAELGDDLAVKSAEYATARAPLSLVLQACGRGLRSPTDRCVFVLLDSRYGGNGGLDWRRFLDPPPYNAARPELSVETFHVDETPAAIGDWDPEILAACTRRP